MKGDKTSFKSSSKYQYVLKKQPNTTLTNSPNSPPGHTDEMFVQLSLLATSYLSGKDKILQKQKPWFIEPFSEVHNKLKNHIVKSSTWQFFLCAPKESHLS